METGKREPGQTEILARLKKSWFPPAAVAGALASFVAAAFRSSPAPKPRPQQAGPGGPRQPLVQLHQMAPSSSKMEREYSLSGTLGGDASAHPFRRSLAGLAVGPADRIYAMGDEEVRIFGSGGEFVRGWRVPADAVCLGVAAGGHVYVGAPGRVEGYDAAGVRVGGFVVGEKDKPASVTAVKVFRDGILLADASARCIRRYDMRGAPLGVVGTKNKTGSFMLPNRWLDFDMDSAGVIRATDTGRHLVTTWALDGSPLGSFGKFGMSDPADFVGCCNPVNLALTPDGKIVTAEKMVARVKVYEPDGRLLALIGPENFDPNCVHIYLAVDTKGRILTGDPVRRVVRIFSLAVQTGKTFDPGMRRLSGKAGRV
jgi:hypothetical protein